MRPAGSALRHTCESAVGEVVDIHTLAQLAGGLALRAVHAHVERAVPLKRESTLRPIELWRRNAEIDQEAIERRRIGREAEGFFERGQDFGQLGEARVLEDHAPAVAFEPLARRSQRVRVAIDAKQASIRLALFENALGVPPPAKRPITIETARLRRERGNRFL